MRAISGLVRKDAAPKRRTAGHLWPCGERCLGRRRGAGPSVALCGKTPRRSGGPRAICGLVRKDAAPKRRTTGHRWPADPSARKRLDMRCDNVSGGRFLGSRRLTCPARVVRRESCELVNLRERCATRCTQQERPTRPRATKCRGRPRTALASLRAAGAPAHRQTESSTARPVTRPRRGRPAPAG